LVFSVHDYDHMKFTLDSRNQCVIGL